MEITLRKWTITDLDNLVKYADNIHIAQWLTNQFPHPYTREDGEKYLSIISQDNPTKVFAIDLNGEAIGSIGIFPQPDIHEKNAEIGYFLAKPYWGKGIMVQAVGKIVKYGFETFDIIRIFARPFSTNTASQRVLEKAEFTLEARLEKTIFKNGIYMDELIYAVRKHV